MSSRGWLAWFVLSFGTFLFFEVRALAQGKPEKTLSAAIWRWEKFQPGQAVWQWNAAHYLLGGVLLVAFSWLLGHFLLGWWT